MGEKYQQQSKRIGIKIQVSGKQNKLMKKKINFKSFLYYKFSVQSYPTVKQKINKKDEQFSDFVLKSSIRKQIYCKFHRKKEMSF